MRLQVRTSQWVSRALVVALLLTAAPLPCVAGEPPAPPAPAPTLTAAIQHAVAATPLAAARDQATGAKPGKTAFDSPSFFKKPAGIAVLAALAAGVGYAIYSTQHDRIHSAGKK